VDLRLNDRVFIITGGTDGLGAALAEGLVSEGARVAVCGRDEARVRSTETRIRTAGGESGGEILGVVADVTRLADLEQLVAATVAAWGRIDGVVNNAGKSSAAGIESATDEEWVADLDLKVLAAVRLVRAALPHLRAAGGGSIVNVLNIGAKAPGATSMPTAASRAAGLALTKAWSKELGPDNIRVNAVLIGLIESGQWRRRTEASGEDLAELYAEMGQTVPLGRVGRGDEFADLVSYLLSPRSSYVTGSAINLDGGSSPVV
jgi:NAD(P)-dependent dehydrogenase (short-subunit alcohol dehydrogenase family)